MVFLTSVTERNVSLKEAKTLQQLRDFRVLELQGQILSGDEVPGHQPWPSPFPLGVSASTALLRAQLTTPIIKYQLIDLSVVVQDRNLIKTTNELITADEVF